MATVQSPQYHNRPLRSRLSTFTARPLDDEDLLPPIDQGNSIAQRLNARRSILGDVLFPDTLPGSGPTSQASGSPKAPASLALDGIPDGASNDVEGFSIGSMDGSQTTLSNGLDGARHGSNSREYASPQGSPGHHMYGSPGRRHYMGQLYEDHGPPRAAGAASDSLADQDEDNEEANHNSRGSFEFDNANGVYYGAQASSHEGESGGTGADSRTGTPSQRSYESLSHGRERHADGYVYSSGRMHGRRAPSAVSSSRSSGRRDSAFARGVANADRAIKYYDESVDEQLLQQTDRRTGAASSSHPEDYALNATEGVEANVRSGSQSSYYGFRSRGFMPDEQQWQLRPLTVTPQASPHPTPSIPGSMASVPASVINEDAEVVATLEDGEDAVLTDVEEPAERKRLRLVPSLLAVGGLMAAWFLVQDPETKDRMGLVWEELRFQAKQAHGMAGGVLQGPMQVLRGPAGALRSAFCSVAGFLGLVAAGCQGAGRSIGGWAHDRYCSAQRARGRHLRRRLAAAADRQHGAARQRGAQGLPIAAGSATAPVHSTSSKRHREEQQAPRRHTQQSSASLSRELAVHRALAAVRAQHAAERDAEAAKLSSAKQSNAEQAGAAAAVVRGNKQVPGGVPAAPVGQTKGGAWLPDLPQHVASHASAPAQPQKVHGWQLFGRTKTAAAPMKPPNVAAPGAGKAAVLQRQTASMAHVAPPDAAAPSAVGNTAVCMPPSKQQHVGVDLLGDYARNPDGLLPEQRIRMPRRS